MAEVLEMDDPDTIPLLVEYGTQMGQMILDDRTDGAATHQTGQGTPGHIVGLCWIALGGPHLDQTISMASPNE